MHPIQRCRKTRRGEDELHDVFKGIIVGALGFGVWFGVSVVYGIGTGLGGPDNPVFEAFMVIGFALMIGGPLIYIVILPVWGWWRSKRSAWG